VRGRVPRSAVAAISVPVVLSLVLAGCGGDSKAAKVIGEEQPTDGTTDGRDAPPPSDAWPLTGETLDGSLPDHPVYVVKIDNTSSSAPQLGLESADLVVEEMVEGGLTRLAAMFHSTMPDTVGPVRSMRATDIGIVAPIQGVLIAAGGARPTRARIAQAGLADLGESDSGFERDTSRYAPYNLFAHLSEIAGDPGNQWEPPDSAYFQFGEPDLSHARTVTTIDVEFSGSHTTEWALEGDTWVRTNSNADQRDDYPVDTILVLWVREGDAGYRDPAGNPVPETLFYGEGEALLVHGDKALECRWTKESREGQLQLTTDAGESLEVPAGHIFLELLPTATGHLGLRR
jgi:hypothetical protein